MGNNPRRGIRNEKEDAETIQPIIVSACQAFDEAGIRIIQREKVWTEAFEHMEQFIQDIGEKWLMTTPYF